MPRASKARRTNRYSNEFKTKAVRLSLMDGVQVQDVAQVLDIHPFKPAANAGVKPQEQLYEATN